MERERTNRNWPTPADPCWDCGSNKPGHHTKLCDLAPAGAVRDLPAHPGTQWWVGRNEPTDHDLEFANYVRALFPLPCIEDLRDEVTRCTNGVPFGMFGITGGFGPTRTLLVEAIAANQPAAIEQHFYALIREGIADEYNGQFPANGEVPDLLDEWELADALLETIQDARVLGFEPDRCRNCGREGHLECTELRPPTDRRRGAEATISVRVNGHKTDTIKRRLFGDNFPNVWAQYKRQAYQVQIDGDNFYIEVGQ